MRQVDPFGCGCTECVTGLSVPLHEATAEDISNMIVHDDLELNLTDAYFKITVIADWHQDFGLMNKRVMMDYRVDETTVRVWDMTDTQLGWEVSTP